MKAAVSLWSADLLKLGAALDQLTGVADAFHVDVMDGHFVPDLLFGPQVPWEQFEEQMGEEGAIMYRWFNDVGYEANIVALQQEYPELTSIERYLRSHRWESAGVPARG